ncbi:ethanolamine ammonia-lyase subunit EutC [Nocardia stercoris]|uniref:Ethanolamine ammonia-lyase small subunit n=1 Tax=Nocardia stercoris TaxID=2483361 RepID=A0A3M2L2D9_9NOCA|nr:ethanolamine ammonia-lyase subunit EutC [Nocardia stercoris]
MPRGPVPDPWVPLRAHTRARIGLRRAGETLATSEVLSFTAAHALARDAVRTTLEIGSLTAELDGLGLGSTVPVRSAARDRDEYLRRPDLGRVPADPDLLPRGRCDIALVVADGLSATAVAAHAAALSAALCAELTPRYRFSMPVLATQARVALGDHIGAALGATVVLVIIGERPGLSVADSLGIYLTYAPRPGRADSERNCVSNIHPPDGLGYAAAAVTVADLVDRMTEAGRSGVAVKARGGPDAVAAPPPNTQLDQ